MIFTPVGIKSGKEHSRNQSRGISVQTNYEERHKKKEKMEDKLAIMKGINTSIP